MDVAVSDSVRLALIQGRRVFQYAQNIHGDYEPTAAPADLHSRVLFYPSVGFSFSNDTVMLINVSGRPKSGQSGS